MPEPDIPVIEVSSEDVDRISSELIELPDEKKDRYKNDYSLSDYDRSINCR
jgi:aspartyl-tRNA(Asn)/glutamyl-tRNA(Gln) amidotransferase subunit B